MTECSPLYWWNPAVLLLECFLTDKDTTCIRTHQDTLARSDTRKQTPNASVLPEDHKDCRARRANCEHQHHSC